MADQERKMWIEDFLAGAISETDARLLLAALDRDPALLQEMADQVVVNGALEQLHAPVSPSEGVVEAIADARTSRLAERVMRQISERRTLASREGGCGQTRALKRRGRSSACRTASRRCPGAASPRKATRPLLHYVAVPLAAAAAVLIVLYAPFATRQPQGSSAGVEPQEAPSLTLADVRGAVRHVAVSGAKPADATMRIAPGEGLETGADGSATLSWPDGTILLVARETALRIEDTRSGARNRSVALTRGHIQVSVAPQAPGRPFRAATPHLVVTVVGTEFVLLVERDMTRLHVTKGAVRMQAPHEASSHLVRAGQEGRATSSAVRIVCQTRPIRRVEQGEGGQGVSVGLDFFRSPRDDVESMLAQHAADAARRADALGREYVVSRPLLPGGVADGEVFVSDPAGDIDWARPREGFFKELDARVAIANAYGIRLRFAFLHGGGLLARKVRSDDVDEAKRLPGWLRNMVVSWREAGHEVYACTGSLQLGTAFNAVRLLHALEENGGFSPIAP